MNLGQGTCSPQGPRHFVHASLQVRPGLTELVFSLADFCSRHMQLRQQRPESSALTSSLRFPGGIELYKATLAQVQSPKAEEESGAVWACLFRVRCFTEIYMASHVDALLGFLICRLEN